MLDGVIDNYLQGVSEREFDAPLMALLLAQGFYDIHKIHGAYEFGKDFIAKRIEEGGVRQYSIQSKAGNINTASWREIRSQVDEARYNGIAHPSFDRALERSAVLATTGRLVGAAGPDAQEYKAYLSARNEISFDVWDQDTFREWMIRSPENGLAGGADADLMALIGGIEKDEVTDQVLERYTRKWINLLPHRVAIESAVVAERLRAAHRTDLSCTTALCALRAQLARQTSTSSEYLAASARELHATYAAGLLNEYGSVLADPRRLLNKINPTFPHISYPVACHRLAEIFGLLTLNDSISGDAAADARSLLVTLIESQPGLSRPISNRWASAVLVAGVAAGKVAPDAVERWVESTAIWLLDSHDGGWGLAPTNASPDEEVEYLLGPPLAHVVPKRPQQSYLATVLMDLCLALEMNQLYDTIAGDFKAFKIQPLVIVANEEIAKWGAGEFGISAISNVEYPNKVAAQGARVPHHVRGNAEGIGAWDSLALSTLPRNRHSFSALTELANRPVGS